MTDKGTKAFISFSGNTDENKKENTTSLSQ